MSLAYYSGCSSLGSSKDYEISTQAICKVLGINFKKIEDFNCCGSTPAHAMSHELSTALAARNLRLAADTGAEKILTSCPSCMGNLKIAKVRMEDEEFKKEIDALLDTPTTKLLDTYSVLQYLVEDIGLNAIKAKVVKPLTGLKIACYYGCLLTRPPKVANFDDVELPMSMDNLLTALGAECVPFPLKTECCGAASGIADKKTTSILSARLIERAKEFKVDAIAVACPLCQMNLDLRQSQAENMFDEYYDIPAIYFTQLMGIAFGLKENDIQLNKLVVDAKKLVSKIGTSTDNTTGGNA